MVYGKSLAHSRWLLKGSFYSLAGQWGPWLFIPESYITNSCQMGAVSAFSFPWAQGGSPPTAANLPPEGFVPSLKSILGWTDRWSPGRKANPSDSNLFLNRLLPHLK